MLFPDPQAPVLLGEDVDRPTASAFAAAGFAVTRDARAGASVVVTNDPREIPAGVHWVHSPYMGPDRLLGCGWPDDRLLTRTIGRMPQRMAAYVRDALEELPPGTALVVGTGEVGRAIAAELRERSWLVDGVNTSGRQLCGFRRCTTIDTVQEPRQYSAIVLALPAGAASERIVGDELLRRLRGARLVNVGRGSTLDLDAALAALDRGWLAHAVLDVLPVEPLPADDPLRAHPRLTLTPHIAGPTEPADVVESFREALADVADGRVPRLAVDPARGY